MENALEKFILEVNEKPHLHPLLNNVFLSILIQSENKKMYLLINDGKLSFSEKCEKEIDASIVGASDKLKEVIRGETKLRQASNDRSVQINARFRTALFLESLFYLGYK